MQYSHVMMKCNSLKQVSAKAVKRMLQKLGRPTKGSDDCQVTMVITSSQKEGSRGQKIRDDIKTQKGLMTQSV